MVRIPGFCRFTPTYLPFTGESNVMVLVSPAPRAPDTDAAKVKLDPSYAASSNESPTMMSKSLSLSAENGKIVFLSWIYMIPKRNQLAAESRTHTTAIFSVCDCHSRHSSGSFQVHNQPSRLRDIWVSVATSVLIPDWVVIPIHSPGGCTTPSSSCTLVCRFAKGQVGRWSGSQYISKISPFSAGDFANVAKRCLRMLRLFVLFKLGLVGPNIMIKGHLLWVFLHTLLILINKWIYITEQQGKFW